MENLIKIAYGDSKYSIIDKISSQLKIYGLMIEECDSDPADGHIVYKIVKLETEN